MLSEPSLPFHPDRCCRFDQAWWAACGMPTLSSGTVGTKCWNRWDWSGRLHREQPLPQSEAPPIEDNDPQLGPPAGRKEGVAVVSSVKAKRMGRDERWGLEEEVGCRDPKISKGSRKWLQMLQEQVAVGKSGQHTASIWSIFAPSWEKIRGCAHCLDFFVPRKRKNQGLFYQRLTVDYIL